MLTFLVFFPLVGAAAAALLPRAWEGRARHLAAATGLAELAGALYLFAAFDRTAGGFQFLQRATWIESGRIGFDLQYLLGVDGLGLTMVILTALLSVTAILISWKITLRPKEYFAWLLVLEASLMGVFTALDLVLFFLFWEVELLPMYLLIAVWGTGRKEYSAIKYVLFTLFGSSLMLAGILVLGFSAGSFDMTELAQSQIKQAIIPLGALFFLLLMGFAVKLPVVPFHTWLPDAHTDAPTAVSVMLAGVLLKMGGYGILRVNLGVLPEVAREGAPFLAAFAVASVLYGALVTLRQRDLKRLIAYSSVSHMGYVLLGAAALGEVGLVGATLQMFSHGVITGLLFVMVGLVYERAHTRDLEALGGLAHATPLLATVFAIAGLAALGLPGLAGFAAEVTVFLGSFPRYEAATSLAIVGIVLTAGYVLWALQRALFGPARAQWAGLPDATAWWEQATMATLMAVIILVGIYPAVLTELIGLGVGPIALRLG